MTKIDNPDQVTSVKKVVIVVDDDPSVLNSTIMLLELDGYITLGFASGEELLDHGVPNSAICVLMDVRMGVGMDGISVIRALRRRGESVSVVIVTGSGDIPTATRAMNAGAANVLQKPYREEQISAALRDVQEPDLFRTRASELVARLTPSERELIDCLLAGKQNAEIAAVLGIPRNVVEVERSRIMEKLEASSFTEVVRLMLMRRERG